MFYTGIDAQAHTITNAMDAKVMQLLPMLGTSLPASWSLVACLWSLCQEMLAWGQLC